MTKTYFVKPKNDKWEVIGSNNQRANAITDTQAEAIGICKEICVNQQAEMAICGTNGKIRQKNSYGNDPFPPRDKR